MVRIDPPPPGRQPNPVHCHLSAGTQLVRIFDPERRSTQALTFRSHGPHVRFDHHRGDGPARIPCDDPERSVYYASWSNEIGTALESCLVEIFGDTGTVNQGNFHVALPKTSRALILLDLRDNGAMRAGTVAAIAKCDHVFSQTWSRYIYESPAMYTSVDGIVYRNAHNDGPAIVLNERARDGLICHADDILRLDAPRLRALLIAAMVHNNLSF